MTVARYHKVAIALHWVMAIAILLMIASGLTMVFLPIEKSLEFQMYQWHKSLGVLLLWAIVMRILVRILTVRPALPASMTAWEQKAAHLGHMALYALMIIVPITGWVMVSSSKLGLPTIVFGWFEWPHVPGIAMNEAVHEVADSGHEYLAYFFIALIGGHIAAVIKHAVVEKVNLLPRMGIGKLSQGD